MFSAALLNSVFCYWRRFYARMPLLISRYFGSWTIQWVLLYSFAFEWLVGEGPVTGIYRMPPEGEVPVPIVAPLFVSFISYPLLL